MFTRKRHSPSPHSSDTQPSESISPPAHVGTLHKLIRVELLQLSDREMCDFYGFSTSKTLSDYEDGVQPFPLYFLKRFQEFFFVRQSFLESGEGRVFENFRLHDKFVGDYIKKYGFKPWFLLKPDHSDDLECYVVLHKKEIGYDRIITSMQREIFGYHKSADYFRGIIDDLIGIGHYQSEEWVHKVDMRTWAALENGTFYRKRFHFANPDWRCQELYEEWFDRFYQFRKKHFNEIEISRLTEGSLLGIFEWLFNKVKSLPANIAENIFLSAEPDLLELVLRHEPGFNFPTTAEVMRRIILYFKKMRVEDRVRVVESLAKSTIKCNFDLEVEVQEYLFVFGFKMAGDTLEEADQHDWRMLQRRKESHAQRTGERDSADDTREQVRSTNKGIAQPLTESYDVLKDDAVASSMKNILKSPSTREQVFISYNHQDRKWLKKLRLVLDPLVQNKKISLWDDTQIKAGAKWADEINQALSLAKVAVLLVSPNFLASDFIARHELPRLLEAAKNEGLIILWIPVSSSLYMETEIAQYQAAHNPLHPLDGLSDAEVNTILVDICGKIRDAANP